MKVLLVDDEKKFVTMLAKRLVLRGIDADYVYTGEDAIVKAEKSRYDLAILDVKMPGIGGLELDKRMNGNNVEAATGSHQHHHPGCDVQHSCTCIPGCRTGQHLRGPDRLVPVQAV